MSHFNVPAAAAEYVYTVKKSRFIARAMFVDHRNQALQLIDQAKQDFPDARHHCWAYVLGNPNSPSAVAMSDDGEPSGTAGKPILNVLQYQCLGNVIVIIIRYFGGIKLGAGGLIRAYSQATRQVIEQLPIAEQVIYLEQRVVIDYAYENSLRHWLCEHNGFIDASHYSDKAQFTIKLRASLRPAFTDFIHRIGGEIVAGS